MHFPSLKIKLKVIYRGNEFGIWKYPVVTMNLKALLYQPTDDFSRLCFWLDYPGFKKPIKRIYIIDKHIIDVSTDIMQHLFIQLDNADYLLKGNFFVTEKDESIHNWDFAARIKGNVNTKKVCMVKIK